MNTVVVGQGAIGLLWYSYLRENDDSVGLLCSARTSLHPEEITLTRTNSEQQKEQQLTHLASLTPADLPFARTIIFCLKAFDILTALTQYQASIPKHADIILCHNGMIPIDKIKKIIPQNTVMTLLTTHGSKRVAQFHIEHTGVGQSDLGYLFTSKDHTTSSSKVVKQLNQALPKVNWQEDIAKKQWIKLAINCVINPLTAIDDCDNRGVLHAKYLAKIQDVIDEVVQVAQLEGITLSAQELIKSVLAVAQTTATNCSSMRADILAKRRTEIAYINGFIVKTAQKHQIKVPENLQLLQQIQALEVNY